MPTPRTISPTESRRVLLAAQHLSGPPGPRSTPAAVARLIHTLGFVQVDSINVLDRAHNLTLHTRLEGDPRGSLKTLLEERRTLFEHWTHDASIIPTEFYAQWKPRFARYQVRLGESFKTLRTSMRRTLKNRDGVRGRDLRANTDPSHAGGWWNWHPGKVALEDLWRAGELAIARRERFEKVFDLSERIFPTEHALKTPSPEAHIDWACSTALERLGVATPRELAAFWRSIPTSDATAWCARATANGEAEPIVLDDLDGKKRPGVASLNARRLARKEVESDSIRLICPFDPVIRDRDRLMRRFGFFYRFEAFVPKPKRQYGYYTLPLLRGDRFVGRIDPKFDRQANVLRVRGPWWEAKANSRVHRVMLATALDRLTTFLGAGEWQFVDV
jgi:uncharacterized protein YcaQ